MKKLYLGSQIAEVRGTFSYFLLFPLHRLANSSRSTSGTGRDRRARIWWNDKLLEIPPMKRFPPEVSLHRQECGSVVHDIDNTTALTPTTTKPGCTHLRL